MKLYILADRLKRSVEEVLKAAKKLELDIKSSEQKLDNTYGISSILLLPIAS